MPTKKYKKPLPPCPNPELYQLINTKEGSFWRRKRGTVKPAKLNKAFSANVKAMKLVSPIAAKIANVLFTYMQGLTPGRLSSRICAGLLTHYSHAKELSFTPLLQMEIQPQYPLDKLLFSHYSLCIKDKNIEVELSPCLYAIEKQNNLVTEYFFELILLQANSKLFTTLKSNYAVSAPYSFANKHFGGCKLILPLPKNNIGCMALLKVSCTEGNELAAHSKHYAMKVIWVN